MIPINYTIALFFITHSGIPSAGLMVAVFVSGILLLLLLIILLCIFKQRREKNRERAAAEVTQEDENPVYGIYYYGGGDEKIDESKVEFSDNNALYGV